MDNTVQFNRKNTDDYLKGSFKNRLKRENISFDDGKIIVKRLIYESLNNENFNYGNRLLMLLELFKANIRNNKSSGERLNHPTNHIFDEIYNADYVEAENIIRYQIGLVAENESFIDSKKEMEEKNKKLESKRLMKRYGYDKKSTKKSSASPPTYPVSVILVASTLICGTSIYLRTVVARYVFPVPELPLIKIFLI